MIFGQRKLSKEEIADYKCPECDIPINVDHFHSSSQFECLKCDIALKLNGNDEISGLYYKSWFIKCYEDYSRAYSGSHKMDFPPKKKSNL